MSQFLRVFLPTLPVPERPTIWLIVGQGPIALAIGAGEGVLFVILLYPFSFSQRLGDGPIQTKILSQRAVKTTTQHPWMTLFQNCLGWSGGAMVLGKLPVPGRPTNFD